MAENPHPPFRRITSKDVAARAGVGQATVSRVLTNDSHVSEATRQKVLAALRDLHYVPNYAARIMRTGRTDSIGVVVSRLSNPRYPTMLDALGVELWARGLNLNFWNSEQGGDLAARQALARGSVDGVILATATQQNAQVWRDLELGAPVVMINRVVDELSFDSVAVDNFEGGRAVARYLLRHGHERIACVTGDRAASTIRDREAGFFAELEVAGHHVVARELLRRVDFSHAQGRETMRGLLEEENPPTAVFCTNDLLALGATDGMRSLGKSAPEDAWIVGFDDVEMASWDSYRLTTVHQPVQRLVVSALDLLQERILQSVQPVRRIWLPAQLVVRESTGGSQE